MDINGIILALQNLPIWVWVILVFVVLALAGDRKLWELEVKFPLKETVGRGEIEFESYKKKGKSIEVELELETAYQHAEIEIFLNNISVLKIPKMENNQKRFYYSQTAKYQKPKEGDPVSVKIGGQELFSGVLVKD